MGIKIVPHPPFDFWSFSKLRGCRYETIEEMKEAVTKVIDTLTQEDFHEAFQKLLERYNKCIATGSDYFERDLIFMCILSIKVPIRKKSGNLFNDPCNWQWKSNASKRNLQRFVSTKEYSTKNSFHADEYISAKESPKKKSVWPK